MEWAELVLDYVRALAWPAVIGGSVWAFRKQIAAKIGDLQEATTPVGGAKFFDREAREIEQKADQAADRQEKKAEAETAQPEEVDGPAGGEGQAPDEIDSPIATGTSGAGVGESARPSEPKEGEQTPDTHPDAMTQAAQSWLRRESRYRALSAAWFTLNAESNFSTAREVAGTSPEAAVMLAFTDLEKVARAAWVVERMGNGPAAFPTSRIFRELAEGGLDPDFVDVARKLMQLRNRVAHGEGTVSAAGALDFIGACERLSVAVGNLAMSKMRHPSRAQTTGAWLAWMDRQAKTRHDRD
ncbi:MAG: hypothetical protein HYU55_02485 [Nocardioides sp.]|nr:hypothetical protein [Nocardioides sp.]